MSAICSTCFLQSSSGLTRLFVYYGKKWHNTGLSNMLEAVIDRKIIEERKALMSICNHCIKKLTDHYFNNDRKNDNSCHFAGIDSKSLLKPLIMSYPKEANPPTDFINKVDIICLDKIFGYLSPLEILKVEKVCTRWRDIGKYAWHNIKKLNMHCDCPDASEIQIGRMLLYGGHYLRELHVTEPCTSKLIMPLVKKNCFNVEKLALSFKYCREEDFVGAFENMEKLKCLEIVIQNVDNLPVNASARILDSVHAKIEEITLAEYVHFHEPIILLDLPVMLEKFNNLRRLSLKYYHLDNNVLAAIFRKTTLVDLELYNCRFPSTVWFKSNIFNLQQLSLELSENIDVILQHVITSRDLKKLKLRCCRISRQSCENIAEHKNLEILDLRGMLCLGNSDIIGITAECQKLKVLNLDGVQNISPIALETIGQLQYLECLHLPRENVDDQVLRTIANNCKNLEILELNFDGNRSLTVASLRELGNLFNLKQLTFGYGNNVDDTVITKIADNCSKLETLDLWDAMHVTDFSIMALIKKCPLLHSLYIGKGQISVGTLIYASQETLRCQKFLKLLGCSHKIIKVFNELNVVKSPFLTICPSI